MVVNREKERERIRAWRAANRDHVRMYSRTWRAANPNWQRERRAANPEKLRAHRAVANAVRHGKLIRLPCEVCGEIRSQAHHDDYAKPLEVRWLCSTHHAEVHYPANDGARASA